MRRSMAVVCGFVAALAVLITAPGPAHTDNGFEGVFKVSGGLEDGRSYQGEALVVRTGDTYSIAWKIGQEQHFGTAIASGGQLSAVFLGGGAMPPGVAVYRRSADGQVIGLYTVLGGTSTAIETWEPMAVAQKKDK